MIHKAVIELTSIERDSLDSVLRLIDLTGRTPRPAASVCYCLEPVRPPDCGADIAKKVFAAQWRNGRNSHDFRRSIRKRTGVLNGDPASDDAGIVASDPSERR
jgi:hypothetical protein